MLNIKIYTLVIYLISYILKYATVISLVDDIIDLSGLTSNNVPVSKTTDAIRDVNGSTKNVDSETVPEGVPIHHNNFKIKKYINSMGMDMRSSWEPNLVIDVCILS